MENLINKIIKLAPQLEEHKDELYALIKTEIHAEKHTLYRYFVKEFFKHPRFDEIIDAKIATHKHWKNYEENLKWIKKQKK